MILYNANKQPALAMNNIYALAVSDTYTSTISIILSIHDFFAPLKSLACKFRVMLGNLTRSPSRSFFILTWHPNRDVSVNPNARSSMSFSSSSGSSIFSYISSDSTMTWQVEQAQDPPHAPIQFCKCELTALGSHGSEITFHLKVL